MSKHHQQQTRTARDVQVDRVRDRVRELTEPRVETVVQNVLDRAAGQLVQRRTRIEHASLLGQLRGGVAASSVGGSSSTPKSKPATNLEPLAVLEDITAATMTWLRVVDPARASRADMRSVIARLWRLADRAPTLPDEQLRNLDGDVMRWWTAARITTTWGDRPLRPHVPCPECGKRGTIRLLVERTAAMCMDCRTAWDATTIGALGEHVRIALSPAIDLEAEQTMIGPDLPASRTKAPHTRPEVPAVLRGTPLA